MLSVTVQTVSQTIIADVVRPGNCPISKPTVPERHAMPSGEESRDSRSMSYELGT
jgi:hypothetical protein